MAYKEINTMLSIRCLFCMLPVISQAQIAIYIQASQPKTASVQATGLFETTLTEEHKELFHITERLLKNTVSKLTGHVGDVYLKEPGNAIYDNYKLEPVNIVLKPNRTKVNVKTKEVFLNKIQAFNNDDYEKNQYLSLTGYTENNVTCVWKQKDVFPVEILHSIDVIAPGKNSSWNIKSRFGRNIHKTRKVPASASFTVNLPAKRDVTAILSATKVTLAIVVFYTVALTGHVLTKFENTYLWGYENYDIETVMAAAKMPHVLMLSEEITVEYYTNCFIKVFGDDLRPISTSHDNTQCSFVTIDVGENETTDISGRTQHKVSRDSRTETKSLQGNSAATSPEISFLIVTCMFLKIQMF